MSLEGLNSTPVDSNGKLDNTVSDEESCGKEDKVNAEPANATGKDTQNLMTRPKRPLSAYNLFFRDQREILLQALPSRKIGRGHGKIGFQDLAKVIGSKWKNIDAQEKERYEKIASTGRKKYLKLVEEWKEQQKQLGKPFKRKKQISPKVPLNSMARQISFHRQSSGGTGNWKMPLISRGPHVSPETVGYSGHNAPSANESCNGIFPNPFDEFNRKASHTMAFHTIPVPEGITQATTTEHTKRDDRQAFDWINSDNGFPSNHSNHADEMHSAFQPYPMHGNYGCLYNDPMQSFDGDDIEPIPYHGEFTGFESDFARLAGRMGKDCVNCFVGMFGTSRWA